MVWDKNKTTGLIGLIVSLAYVILSFNIMQPPGLTQDLLGSRAFPIGVGILLALSSIAIFFMKLSDEEEEGLGLDGVKRLSPYVLLVIIYIVMMPLIGMLISTILFMLAVMHRMTKGTWCKDAVIVCSISTGLWVLFELVLTIQLP